MQVGPRTIPVRSARRQPDAWVLKRSCRSPIDDRFEPSSTLSPAAYPGRCDRGTGRGPFSVAQIANLPYRRLLIGRASAKPTCSPTVVAPQDGILRHSRLAVCATDARIALTVLYNQKDGQMSRVFQDPSDLLVGLRSKTSLYRCDRSRSDCMNTASPGARTPSSAPYCSLWYGVPPLGGGAPNNPPCADLPTPPCFLELTPEPQRQEDIAYE